MSWRLLIALGFGFGASLRAESTNTVPAAAASNGFEAFRIISQRNIFDPNRSARGSSRRSSEDAPKAAKTESFSLVGTMLYESGQYAFFDSSSSTYRKALKEGDSIAGYKVNSVSPNGVKLEHEGKTLELAVGQQLRRQEEGEWSVSGKAAAEETKTASSSAASTDDEDEAVKRLMKKREEEMNK